MSDTEPSAFATRIAGLAERYLDCVLACARTLRVGFDRYLAGDGIADAVDRLRALESDADDVLREVREAVAGMPPVFSELYLRPDEAVTVFDRTDEIANRAEGVVEDVWIVEPELAPVDAQLVAVCEEVVTMVGLLADAVRLHFADPTGSGASGEIGPLVDEVRERERTCDTVRVEALQRLFDDGTDAASLAARDVVVALDGFADAVEDAANHLLYVEQTAR